MKLIRLISCLLVAALLPGFSILGGEIPLDKVERVRTDTALLGAAMGMGTVIAVSFGLLPPGTPLSDSLLVAIPVAAMASVIGALVGRGIAEVILAIRPPPLESAFLGAGLGFLGGAVIGGTSFALTAAIAIPTIAAPEGYWGRFNYPQAVGMGFVAGAFWMGLVGIPVGVLTVPIVSLYLGF